MGTEQNPPNPPDEEPIDIFRPEELSEAEIEELEAGKRRHPSNPYPEEPGQEIDF